MKFFSDCSGECCVCALAGGLCLAGHGDDYFTPATKEQIIKRLEQNAYDAHRDYMIRYLRFAHGYDYEENAKDNKLKGGRSYDQVMTELKRIWPEAEKTVFAKEKTENEVLFETIRRAAYSVYLLGVEDGAKETTE